MDHFVDALKKYADFSGRATRTQYWMFMFIYMIIEVTLQVIEAVVGTLILTPLFVLALFLPSIAVGARRLHDTSRSGWWQLMPIVPAIALALFMLTGLFAPILILYFGALSLIGGIVLLVFLVQDSHADNRFGPDPKIELLLV